MFALDTKFQIRPGDLLIAEPFLPDPNFSRAVAYIVEHNDEGTIGFVLNQATGVALKDVLPGEVGEELDIPLYSGGPVSPETLHVIHQLGDHIPGSKYIARHTYWGGDFEQIKFRNGGESLQLYSNRHSVVLYDKAQDLIKPEKRAIDKDQNSQNYPY